MKAHETQRQMVAGLPNAVLLKSIPLDSQQKRAISAIQAGSHQEQEFQIITPRRFSLLISLAFHLIVGMIATLFVVQIAEIDDDVVIAEILQLKEPPKPRHRIPARRVKRIENPRSSQTQPPRLQQPITTAVKIPTGDARFTLPASDISIPIQSAFPGGTGIGAGGLERRLLSGKHHAQIPSVIPKIEPGWSIGLSIIDKIESAQIPQADFNPDAVEPPTVDLSDVTQPPRFLHRVLPKYPELARCAQREGIVHLEVSIGVDGIARDIKVIRGIGFGCDKAAIEALKALRFAPAKRGDGAVIVRNVQIPYHFKLED